MSFPPYVIVFAMYPFEVEHYRVRIGLGKTEVKMASRHSLDAIRIEGAPVRMPYVGSFWKRNDAPELVECAKQVGILVTYSGHPNIYDPRVTYGISSKYL